MHVYQSINQSIYLYVFLLQRLRQWNLPSVTLPPPVRCAEVRVAWDFVEQCGDAVRRPPDKSPRVRPAVASARAAAPHLQRELCPPGWNRAPFRAA